MNLKDKLNEMVDYDKAFDELVEKGCIEVCGIDNDGAPLYRLTDLGRKVFEGIERLHQQEKAKNDE